ncbi:phage integrase N-terminal SAM-like domain-containing protein [Polaromonas sp.]|uniref:phage integrase N-terminal SAM-like domain-containing protein n=1 Tax=Polaromonas sp. TaxID=1869339 RepID=UPI001E100DB1|nr:phage integrase N-terminal SAM-like domain-containing protein [Polaromonas sp.]MBT9476372.1 phage integrase N-terminal SAM-like domain-containing protein [Polaromonas sp.]
MNSVAYLPQSKRLLEQVSEVLRYKHYSLKTEQAYLYWVRFSVRWHGRDGQMQHPRSMGGAEVTQFLTVLANERRVSVSTHNQALSALLFLYREVLAINLPWLTEVQRPTRPRRIPSVLTKAEVASLLGAMDGEMALLAKLLNGTGMRLMEGLRLHRVHARGAAGRNRGGGQPHRQATPAAPATGQTGQQTADCRRDF